MPPPPKSGQTSPADDPFGNNAAESGGGGGGGFADFANFEVRITFYAIVQDIEKINVPRIYQETFYVHQIFRLFITFLY